MPIPIPETDYPELIDIIDETYTDGLDRILVAEIADDDSIVCVGQDGDKKLAIQITDSDIKIKLFNSNPTAQLSAVSAQFAAIPKKKNCKTGISCGASCISATKVCRSQLSESQKKQKPPIVASAGDKPKVEKKPKVTKSKTESKLPTASSPANVDAAKTKQDPFNLDAAIKAIEDSNARKMDKSSMISSLKKLDLSKESHVAYAKASIETAGFYQKKADGTIVDIDAGGTTSSFDRSSELMRISNRKEISDDEARDAGDSLRQGLRGHQGSEVNKASALLGRDIFNRLTESQKKIFAAEMQNHLSFLNKAIDSNDPFVKELNKNRN